MNGAHQIPYVPPQPDIQAPRLLYPPWMDPVYVMRASYTRPALTVVAGADNIARIPGNNNRWALGITLMEGGTLPVLRASPYSDPQLFPVFTAFSGARHMPLWLTLFQHGPVVCGEIFVECPVGESVRVVEVVLTPGGIYHAATVSGAERLPVQDGGRGERDDSSSGNGSSGAGERESPVPGSVRPMGGGGRGGYKRGDKGGRGK